MKQKHIIMGDVVYLDPCNKRFVDKYTKLASVPSKQSTKPAKVTIYSFVETITLHSFLAICTERICCTSNEKREERGSQRLVYNGQSVAYTSDQNYK